MPWSWLTCFHSATRQRSSAPPRPSVRRSYRRGVTKSGFKPTVMTLEDRTVPSGGPFGGPVPPIVPPFGGPATHLKVIAPDHVQAGQTFGVLVIAETASNFPAFGFTDSISLSSSDSTATGSAKFGSPLTALPLSYTFTPRDFGFHFFQVNLTTPGSESITATDTTSTSVDPGTASITVNPAPTLAKLVVVTPKSAAVGVPTPVTVVAEDMSGHLLPNFTGTVTLSTSDTAATGLPASYTFTTGDHGFHTFKVTFETPDTSSSGPTTVTATDGSITGTASLLVEAASTVTRFGIFAIRPVVQGAVTPVFVVALNASNQIVPDYAGTVSFSSSDMTATAAATAAGAQTPLASFSYTFGAADAGVHVFYLTFGTTGKQTLTVGDSAANVSNTIDFYVVTTAPRHIWWFF
jgi:hypothetical protein